MILSLEIKSNDDALSETDPAGLPTEAAVAAVVELLRGVVGLVASEHVGGRLIDPNGNSAGGWSIDWETTR